MPGKIYTQKKKKKVKQQLELLNIRIKHFSDTKYKKPSHLLEGEKKQNKAD